MLQSIHVKNIALIDEVEMELKDGLNILSGETGAGKSILIDSVSFALGKRMPKDIVRDDAQYALCELVFDLKDEDTIRAIEEMDIPIEDGQVILQRKIMNGKNVCKCNGESVSAAQLQQISHLLIDIHGQHDHQSLLYKKNHRILLDKFCKEECAVKLAKLEETYHRFEEAEEEYLAATDASATRDRDMEYSQYVVDEINAAKLVAGEDEELETLYRRMNNSKRILEAVQGAYAGVSDDSQGASAGISHALSYLKTVTALDDSARELFEQLEEIESLVSDFTRSLSDYEDGMTFSAEEYEETEERLNLINRMKEKYGDSIEKILARAAEEEEKIERLSDYEAYASGLKVKLDELYHSLVSQCEEVSKIRRKEAEILSEKICIALKELNFLDSRFVISVTPVIDKITSVGYDDIEFLISTNPGEDLRALTLVASGGELSRIMLALKAVLAQRDAIETVIFDEIDTGISGKTAQMVADKLSSIASSHQVICITHLPQIASHANVHFNISKNVEDGRTITRVTELDYDSSVDELARMLSGAEITDAVRANAREMKDAYAGLSG